MLQLPHPRPAQPYIKGLLDPCTNSMTTPNIPAEKLYDKKVRTAALNPMQSLTDVSLEHVKFLGLPRGAGGSPHLPGSYSSAVLHKSLMT